VPNWLWQPVQLVVKNECAQLDQVSVVQAGALTVSPRLVVRVRPPPTPLTVTAYEPAAVPDEVDSVSVVEPEPLTVLGLNKALAPDGRPDTEKEMEPAKPFTALVVMVDAPLWPAVIDSEDGLAASEKSGGGGAAAMERAMVTVCVALPPLAVMVSVELPGVAVVACTESVAEPLPPKTVPESNDAVEPAGTPDTVNETSRANPLLGVMVTVLLAAAAPSVIEREAGLAETRKSGGGAGAVMVSSTVAECETPPPLAFTVMA
jgi:hypothetical protein